MSWLDTVFAGGLRPLHFPIAAGNSSGSPENISWLFTARLSKVE